MNIDMSLVKQCIAELVLENYILKQHIIELDAQLKAAHQAIVESASDKQ